MPIAQHVVEELLTRETIRRLKHQNYCWCVDRMIAGESAALSELTSCFCPDVVADFTGFPLAEGIDAVTEFFAHTVTSALAYAQHRVSNEIVEIDGDAARGRWYLDCPVVFRPGNPLGLTGTGIIIGRYEEEFRREGNVWKWQRIRALLDVISETGGDWSGARLLRENRYI